MQVFREKDQGGFRGLARFLNPVKERGKRQEFLLFSPSSSVLPLSVSCLATETGQTNLIKAIISFVKKGKEPFPCPPSTSRSIMVAFAHIPHVPSCRSPLENSGLTAAMPCRGIHWNLVSLGGGHFAASGFPPLLRGACTPRQGTASVLSLLGQ